MQSCKVVQNWEPTSTCEREELKNFSFSLLFQQHWGSYFLLLRPPAAAEGGAIGETCTRHHRRCHQQDQRALETLQQVWARRAAPGPPPGSLIFVDLLVLCCTRRSRVYMADLESTLDYSLRVELAANRVFRGDVLVSLKKYISVLVKV